ncbi:MAG: LytTR family transcriptional regulator DNA-binding domain-containing protein [Ruminococcus sp.]
MHRIPVSGLCWVESRGHRLTYHTKEGEYESTTSSMKELEQDLGTVNFFAVINVILSICFLSPE